MHSDDPAGAMIRLHDYWRSGAAYRVRLALALKGVAYAQVPHDLRTGAQHDPAYLALNPQAQVPTLETDDGALVQSIAILEWLEERHPDPPLLPADPAGRTIVRGMMAAIACDIHPLHNLRVLARLREDFGADEAQGRAWIAHWIATGLAALEPVIARHGAGFAYGTTPTLADCCLVPQLHSAERFGVDVSAWPRLAAAAAATRALPAAAAAHPAAQPDADPA